MTGDNSTGMGYIPADSQSDGTSNLHSENFGEMGNLNMMMMSGEASHRSSCSAGPLDNLALFDQFVKLLDSRCLQLQDLIAKHSMDMIVHNRREADVMVVRVADLEERFSQLEKKCLLPTMTASGTMMRMESLAEGNGEDNLSATDLNSTNRGIDQKAREDDFNRFSIATEALEDMKGLLDRQSQRIEELEAKLMESMVREAEARESSIQKIVGEVVPAVVNERFQKEKGSSGPLSGLRRSNSTLAPGPKTSLGSLRSNSMGPATSKSRGGASQSKLPSSSSLAAAAAAATATTGAGGAGPAGEETAAVATATTTAATQAAAPAGAATTATTTTGSKRPSTSSTPIVTPTPTAGTSTSTDIMNASGDVSGRGAKGASGQTTTQVAREAAMHTASSRDSEVLQTPDWRSQVMSKTQEQDEVYDQTLDEYKLRARESQQNPVSPSPFQSPSKIPMWEELAAAALKGSEWADTQGGAASAPPGGPAKKPTTTAPNEPSPAGPAHRVVPRHEIVQATNTVAYPGISTSISTGAGLINGGPSTTANPAAVATAAVTNNSGNHSYAVATAPSSYNGIAQLNNQSSRPAPATTPAQAQCLSWAASAPKVGLQRSGNAASMSAATFGVVRQTTPVCAGNQTPQMLTFRTPSPGQQRPATVILGAMPQQAPTTAAATATTSAPLPRTTGGHMTPVSTMGARLSLNPTGPSGANGVCVVSSSGSGSGVLGGNAVRGQPPPQTPIWTPPQHQMMAGQRPSSGLVTSSVALGHNERNHRAPGQASVITTANCTTTL